MTMPDLKLTSRRTIKAPPEKIFNAWLVPDMMAKFMSPRPDMHVREARADARVGGRFYVAMVDGDKEHPHEGTYKEITPYSRLVFTWEVAWSAPGTYVQIDLTPKGDATEVVLTHVKFLSEDSRDNHAKGWAGILGKLDALCAEAG
jgi:uncharacterized protein YndB with AHSA1/START domain